MFHLSWSSRQNIFLWCVLQLFSIRFLMDIGIQIRQRSNMTAIFFAFPQGFNIDYSNVSRIKPTHCFAGGAVKQNGWDFVFIADNLLYFHKNQHFSILFVCVNITIFFPCKYGISYCIFLQGIKEDTADNKTQTN